MDDETHTQSLSKMEALRAKLLAGRQMKGQPNDSSFESASMTSEEEMQGDDVASPVPQREIIKAEVQPRVDERMISQSDVWQDNVFVHTFFTTYSRPLAPAGICVHAKNAFVVFKRAMYTSLRCLPRLRNPAVLTCVTL